MENKSLAKIQFREKIRECVDNGICQLDDLVLDDLGKLIALRTAAAEDGEIFDMINESKASQKLPALIRGMLLACEIKNKDISDYNKQLRAFKVIENITKAAIECALPSIEKAIEDALIDKRRDDIEEGVNINGRQNVSFN
jgi:hypothetical protein